MAYSNRNPSRAEQIVDLHAHLAPTGMIPPQVVDFEQSLLGAMMIDKNSATVAMSVIGRPDAENSPFYRDAHKSVYEACLALESRSEPIDILTVTDELRKTGDLDAVGGPSYIVELTTQNVTTVNVEAHARVILEKQMLRRLIEACELVKLQAYELGDPHGLIDTLDEHTLAIRSRFESKGLRHVKKGWDALWKEIQMPAENGVRGLPIGIPEFDDLSGGFLPGEQVILAAMTSRGKTANALAIARNALKMGKAVAFFSLETTERKILMRQLIAETGIDRSAINSGRFERRDDWITLKNTIEAQKKLPLYIDDSGARTTFEIRAEIKKLARKVDLGLVIVDYLQLVDQVGRADTREREVTMISRQLRAIWKEFNVVGLCLSQFSRATNDDRPPQLSHLRESGALEQDARQIMFIHYPYRNGQLEIPDIETIQLILAKNDGGPVGSVEIDFDKRLGRFTERGLVPNIPKNLEPITAPAF